MADDEHGRCLDCGARQPTVDELLTVSLPYCLHVCPNGDKNPAGPEELGPLDVKRVIARFRDAADAQMFGHWLDSMQNGVEAECWLGFVLGALDADFDAGRLDASEHAALTQALQAVVQHLGQMRGAHRQPTSRRPAARAKRIDKKEGLH